MKKRVFSFLLLICMMLSQVLVAYAEGSSETIGTETIKTGLCEHHTTHDENCGYVEAVEGSQCTHKHSEICYQTLRGMHKHSGGTATCTDKAVCDYCGMLYGELDSSNHTGRTEIKNDKDATCTEDGYTGDTYCKDCGEKLQYGIPLTKLGHIDADKNHVCDRENCKATLSTCSGGTATCKDKAVCDYCGKPYGDFDSSIHAGGTHIKNDKAATCNEDGYTGDTYCKGCDTKLSSGKSVDKTGHDYESKVTKEATTTSTGTKTYTCKNCGHSYEEEIAKLPSQSTSPKTGDETPLAMTIAVTTLSAVALAVLLLLNKKRKVN